MNYLFQGWSFFDRKLKQQTGNLTVNFLCLNLIYYVQKYLQDLKFLESVVIIADVVIVMAISYSNVYNVYFLQYLQYSLSTIFRTYTMYNYYISQL